jgi:hypothetical protein
MLRPQYYSGEDYDYPIALFEKNGEYFMLGFYFDAEEWEQHPKRAYHYYWVSFKMNTTSTVAKLFPFDTISLHRFLKENNIDFTNIAGIVNNKKSITGISYAPSWNSRQ